MSSIVRCGRAAKIFCKGVGGVAEIVGTILAIAAAIRLIAGKLKGHDFGAFVRSIIEIYHDNVSPIISFILEPLNLIGITLSDAQKDMLVLYFLVGSAAGRTIFKDQYVPGSRGSRGFNGAILASILAITFWPMLILFAVWLVREGSPYYESEDWTPARHFSFLRNNFFLELSFVLTGTAAAILIGEATK